MAENISFWFSVAGAAFGFIGMVTGVLAIVYARRQAIAAEGPNLPDVECNWHGWSPEEREQNWYIFNLVIRNRTDRPFALVRAKANKGIKMISQYGIPTIGPAWEGKRMDLADLTYEILPDFAAMITTVAPSGIKGNPTHVGSSDIGYETVYAFIPDAKRVTSLSIKLTFEERSAVVRPHTVKLRRRLAPKRIILT